MLIPNGAHYLVRYYIVMRAGIVYLVACGLLAMLGLFVFGWFINGRDIPDIIFNALLGLLGSIVAHFVHLATNQRKEEE